jgi:hypothetical protein
VGRRRSPRSVCWGDQRYHVGLAGGDVHLREGCPTEEEGGSDTEVGSEGDGAEEQVGGEVACWKYDHLFAREFVVCLATWVRNGQPGNWPMACVAEELALHALTEEAGSIIEVRCEEADFADFWELAFKGRGGVSSSTD